jgi:hypothetical protein
VKANKQKGGYGLLLQWILKTREIINSLAKKFLQGPTNQAQRFYTVNIN